MIVCLCKNVTELQIEQLVQNGKTTLRDVVETSQAGTCCGACFFEVEKIVEDTRTTHRRKNDRES